MALRSRVLAAMAAALPLVFAAGCSGGAALGEAAAAQAGPGGGIPAGPAPGPQSLSETGSTLLYPVLHNWAAAYRQQHANVSIATAATGSGKGIAEASAGHVDIGASDAYLSTQDAPWDRVTGYGTTVNWPPVPGARAETRNTGMVAGCRATPGCVAYIGIAYLTSATNGGLGYASLRNALGDYEPPTPKTIGTSVTGFVSTTPVSETISMVDGPANPRLVHSLAAVAAGLPVYTEYVSQAQTQFLLGYRLTAGSLMQVASEEMHLTLLPAARASYAQENAALTAASGQATGLPWIVVVLVLAIVLAFVLYRAQRWLSRSTHRVFNIGMLAATAAAGRDLQSWYRVIGQAYALDSKAQYTTETALVIGPGASASTAGFARVEADLSKAINADDAVFHSNATAGRNAFTGLGVVIVIVAALMAAGCAWGLSRRLAEYR